MTRESQQRLLDSMLEECRRCEEYLDRMRRGELRGEDVEAHIAETIRSIEAGLASQGEQVDRVRQQLAALRRTRH